jgi:hypothetical protein
MSMAFFLGTSTSQTAMGLWAADIEVHTVAYASMILALLERLAASWSPAA